nr:hypothetical protein [Tanacetum cinerariifolium]
MDLFAFIYHANPTKVLIVERKVGEEESGDAAMANQIEGSDHVVQDEGVGIVHIEDEVPAVVVEKAKGSKKKRKTAGGSSGLRLPPKKLRVDNGTFGTGAGTGKDVRGGHTDSFTGPNLRTQRVAKRFVVLSDSSHRSSTNVADDEVTSIIRSFMPPPPILTVVVATTIIVDATSASASRAGTEPVPRSIFRDSVSTGVTNQDVGGPSHLAGIELSTNSFFVMDYKQLFVKFNVVAAGQTCLSFEVATVEAAEAARVNELNGLKERTMALEGQDAALEFAVVIKDTELVSSNAQITKLTQDLSNFQLSCDELSVKAASLEFEKDKLAGQVSTLEAICSRPRDEATGYKLLKEQIEAVQDEQVKVLSDHVAEYLAALGGAIGRAIDKGMQDGLTVSIDHEKAGRGLIEVAAYNPSVEANYIFAINALRIVGFPLLAQLESQKDASMADIMDLLCLEGPAAETLKASHLQPSHEQLMLPIDMCTNIADITKKWSKPDKNEHEIVKNAQKPDPKIFLCSKSQVKSKLQTQRANSANCSKLENKMVFLCKSSPGTNAAN